MYIRILLLHQVLFLCLGSPWNEESESGFHINHGMGPRGRVSCNPGYQRLPRNTSRYLWRTCTPTELRCLGRGRERERKIVGLQFPTSQGQIERGGGERERKREGFKGIVGCGDATDHTIPPPVARIQLSCIPECIYDVPNPYRELPELWAL